MSLKGQYVKAPNGQTGMIESEEPDEFNLVMVYFGTLDKHPVRTALDINVLEPIDSPRNARIDGEIPPEELKAPKLEDGVVMG